MLCTCSTDVDIGAGVYLGFRMDDGGWRGYIVGRWWATGDLEARWGAILLEGGLWSVIV